MPAGKRAEIRRACSAAGIEVSGLHWLLVAPAGLSITTADRTAWQKSVGVLRASVDLCAELGGSYLVHGSPAQRRVITKDDAARAGEAWLLPAEPPALANAPPSIPPLAERAVTFAQ